RRFSTSLPEPGSKESTKEDINRTAPAPDRAGHERPRRLREFAPILLAKLRDLRHQVIGDLFVRAEPVAFGVEFVEGDRLAEPYADLLTAAPIAHDLLDQIVPKATNKNGQHLWPGLIDDLSDARLGG